MDPAQSEKIPMADPDDRSIGGPARPAIVTFRQEDQSSTMLRARMMELGVEQHAESKFVIWCKGTEQHPRNWTWKRKTYDMLVISLLEFFTTIISTTGPSAAALARNKFGLGTLTSLVAFTITYQVGKALGGLTIPPCSECFGRRIPYIVSGTTFALFCFLTGVLRSLAAVVVARFVTGFASAVPSVVVAGSVDDIFDSRARIWLVLVWSSLSTGGLVFGLIFGVYIGHAHGWQWIYYASSIGTAILTLSVLGIRESRPSLLLSKRVDILRREFGQEFQHENCDSVASTSILLEKVILRPGHLLISEPIVILVATVGAISWSIVYLFTEAMTGIYQSIGFAATTSSLPFLAMGSGVCFSILPRFYDRKVAAEKIRNRQLLQPEDKLAGFVLAVIALALGLWVFSWTIPPMVGAPSVIPTLALVPVGFAVNEIAYTLSGYLSDCYTVYAASAFAALGFLRAVVSGITPLVGYVMFTQLSANLAGSVIATTATLFGVAPYILLRRAKRLREQSEFARHSSDVEKRTAVA